MGNDKLLLTSTQIGYKSGPDGSYPRSNFQSLTSKPIPLGLREGRYNLIDQTYTTTAGQDFSPKVLSDLYRNDEYKKANHNWKVNYAGNVEDLLSSYSGCRQLTTGNQSSEMRATFQGNKEVQIDMIRNRPHVLSEHHQRFHKNVSNGKLKPIYIKESVNRNNVDRLVDPYLSQSQLNYAPNIKEKLEGYAKNDTATYWACEEYPKVHGFGPKVNPLPKPSRPPEGLVADRNPYFSKIKTIRHPIRGQVIPHSGLHQTYKTYKSHDLNTVRQSQIYDVKKTHDFEVTDHGSLDSLPNMYNTTYRIYGTKPNRSRGLSTYF